MKTSELSGAALDWAAAKAEGMADSCEIHAGNVWYGRVTSGFTLYSPTNNWAQGGPIIERECICIARLDPQEDEFGNRSNDFWVAHIDGVYCRYGVSAIVAAMRCYVASKLGDEVEIPEGLV
jgi:hypothetical protein